MKEIDFLPEWYKSGRRRQLSYRTQYMALGGVLAVMIVWNFVATHSISKAKAQLVERATEQAQSERVSVRLCELRGELGGLQKRAEFIEQIDSKIDVASVLAEMSFLIDEKIVLSKVEFVAEKLVDKQDLKPSPHVGAVVRVVQAKLSQKRELPLGDVRFKVVIAGVAPNASDVMALICKLEESAYFCQVVLSFSRDAKVEVQRDLSARSRTGLVEGTAGPDTSHREGEESLRVSEFEISCYLANYREQ